jgi:protein-arginine kinase
MQKGGDVGAVFKRLVDAVNALQAKMKFLQTGHLGFLSSCPTNLGTGLRASVHIAIPHVSKLDNFKELCKGYSIQPRGIHGEHSESEGGVYDLSNLHRLGLSEFQAVTQMYDGIKKIIELEKELAAKSG